MSTAKIPGLNSLQPPPPLGHFPGDHNHRGHSVQFYAEDSFLMDGVTRLVGTALGAGDAAIVIATKSHREGLEARLQARGLNTMNVMRQGRYFVADAAETLSKFMIEGFPDAQRFRETIGSLLVRARSATEPGSRVVAFGEMVALLWEEGKYDAAIRVEQLWNELGREHAFFLHCAYRIKDFAQENSGAPFMQICSEHSEVLPSESYTSLNDQRDRHRNIALLQQKEQAHDALRETKTRLIEEVAERVEVERKLRASERSLRELSGRLLKTQDEERRHLGRELHDSVGQYLAVLKMELEVLRADAAPASDTEQRRFADCLRLVDQSITEVRTMSYLLYPPMLEEMGLETAISWYLDGFAKRSGVQTKFEMPYPVGRVQREAELAIFRILQESLTNLHRHSESTIAEVRLVKKDGEVLIEITDQGKGIPSPVLESVQDSCETTGVGLRGMTERMRQLGGKLEVVSSSGGTTVRARLACL
jgi:signal transduction histidine kinase